MPIGSGRHFPSVGAGHQPFATLPDKKGSFDPYLTASMLIISFPIWIGGVTGGSASFLHLSFRGLAIRFLNIRWGSSYMDHPTLHWYDPRKLIFTIRTQMQSNSQNNLNTNHCRSPKEYGLILLKVHTHVQCQAQFYNPSKLQCCFPFFLTIIF